MHFQYRNPITRFSLIFLTGALLVGTNGCSVLHSTGTASGDQTTTDNDERAQNDVRAEEPDEVTEANEDAAPVDSSTFIQSLLGSRVEAASDIPVCEAPWIQHVDQQRDKSLYLCEQFEEVDSGFETGSLALFVESELIIGGMHHPAYDTAPPVEELASTIYSYLEAHGCDRESPERVTNDVEFSCPEAEAVVSQSPNSVGIFYVQSAQHLPHISANFGNVTPVGEFENSEEGLRLPEGGVTVEQAGIERPTTEEQADTHEPPAEEQADAHEPSAEELTEVDGDGAVSVETLDPGIINVVEDPEGCVEAGNCEVATRGGQLDEWLTEAGINSSQNHLEIQGTSVCDELWVSYNDRDELSQISCNSISDFVAQSVESRKNATRDWATRVKEVTGASEATIQSTDVERSRVVLEGIDGIEVTWTHGHGLRTRLEPADVSPEHVERVSAVIRAIRDQ